MKRFSSLLIACMCVFMLVGCQSQKNNFYKNTEEPYHYFQDYTLKLNKQFIKIERKGEIEYTIGKLTEM